MKTSVAYALFACALCTAGCGVESASTAATAAALKQKEIEAGKKTMSQAEKQIGDAVQQQLQSAQKADGDK